MRAFVSTINFKFHSYKHVYMPIKTCLISNQASDPQSDKVYVQTYEARNEQTSLFGL